MTVSLLQWNVWLEESVERIIDELIGIDADILCLQELTTRGHDANHDWAARIGGALGMNVHHAVAHRWDEDGISRTMGNAVLSRFPLRAPREVIVRTPAPGVRGRVYVEAELDLPSGPLTVGTTHLSYVRAHEDTDDKRREAEALVVALGDTTVPRVLTGDFNAMPGTSTLRAVESVLANAGPDVAIPTWTTKPYSNDGFSADTLEWRLDYIFVSKGVRVVSTEVIDTTVSDHLPLLAILGH